MDLTSMSAPGVESLCMGSSKGFTRALNGEDKEPIGEVTLPIEKFEIGPCTFDVTFQVSDIPNPFNLLLGDPDCIHAACAIPSSLHQKVKFVVNGKYQMSALSQKIKGQTVSALRKLEVNAEAVHLSKSARRKARKKIKKIGSIALTSDPPAPKEPVDPLPCITESSSTVEPLSAPPHSSLSPPCISNHEISSINVNAPSSEQAFSDGMSRAPRTMPVPISPWRAGIALTKGQSPMQECILRMVGPWTYLFS
ncbi:hypothetical protein CRG98_006471 [Punica granatum]|uniref:Uncharacterized protein n=1 Tax=Punica granatum TaxID=22663 RepID=A0A2I0KXE6_PUNGR|nr:hypothetical protein CRG98_006471 [Punica granatum]